MAVYTQGFLHA
jgi:penicillin G amidase